MKLLFTALFCFEAAATETAGGMDIKTLNTAIDGLGKTVKDSVEKVKQDLSKEQDDKIKAAIKASEDTLQDEISKAKAAAKKAEDMVEEIKQKQATGGFGAGGRVKSYGTEVAEKLTSVKDKLGSKQLFDIEMDRKTVGDMASATSLTGSYFVTPDVRPGIVLQPYNQVHMRDLLPIGSTNSNLIRHLRDNGGQGGPAMVAEGGSKPEMDRALSIEDAAVRKVATHLRVPEEMIEDIPYLTSFITNIGTQEVLAVEDAQILYGAGTGQNISGLFTNATAFSAGASKVAAPNQFDVLRAARKQMRVLKRMPNFALVSPSDYFVMTSAKDSTNNYILQGGGNGLVPTLDGVPIIEMNQVADGDFLVGDRLGAEIDYRSNIQIRFYDQDRDNPIKNMVTIVIEERLALPIYYVNGFIKGTFAAGITALTPA